MSAGRVYCDRIFGCSLPQIQASAVLTKMCCVWRCASLGLFLFFVITVLKNYLFPNIRQLPVQLVTWGFM